MAVAVKCLEATLSLTGEDEAERIEGVVRLKNIGRLMKRSDNDYPEVLQNIRREGRFGGGLGRYFGGRGRIR